MDNGLLPIDQVSSELENTLWYDYINELRKTKDKKTFEFNSMRSVGHSEFNPIINSSRPNELKMSKILFLIRLALFNPDMDEDGESDSKEIVTLKIYPNFSKML
jgi:hypothetical protein